MSRESGVSFFKPYIVMEQESYASPDFLGKFISHAFSEISLFKGLKFLVVSHVLITIFMSSRIAMFSSVYSSLLHCICMTAGIGEWNKTVLVVAIETCKVWTSMHVKCTYF